MSEYTAHQIVTKIHELRDLRKKCAEIQLELAEMATNLGMDQAEALKGDRAQSWLDGYLVTIGVTPKGRNPK